MEKLTKEKALETIVYINSLSKSDRAMCEDWYENENELRAYLIDCIAKGLYKTLEEVVEVANIVNTI